MIIEYLYSDVTALYGDSYNIKYLSECVKDCQVIHTAFNDVPYFVNHKVDLIYMGSMMERYQEIIIKQLKPYREKIKELIEEGTFFLMSGNALEIFGNSIDDIKALQIFDYTSKRDFSHHHNSCFLGKIENMKIVGFKSCFSYTTSNSYPFIEVEKGYGFVNSKNEGIKYKNFYGTYLIGPLMILNPDFCQYFLTQMNVEYNLPFYQAVYQAYQIRLKEFESYKEFKKFKH